MRRENGGKGEGQIGEGARWINVGRTEFDEGKIEDRGDGQVRKGSRWTSVRRTELWAGKWRVDERLSSGGGRMDNCESDRV